MSMPNLQFPEPNVVSHTTADVRFGPATEKMTYVSCPVRQPEEDINDFKVEVWASTLKRCRVGLEELQNLKFPFAEVALALASASLGAVLSAIASNIKYDSNLGFWFYNIGGPIFAASSVAYFFLRERSFSEPIRISRAVMQDLPDPDKSRPVKDNHESQ